MNLRLIVETAIGGAIGGAIGFGIAHWWRNRDEYEWEEVDEVEEETVVLPDAFQKPDLEDYLNYNSVSRPYLEERDVKEEFEPVDPAGEGEPESREIPTMPYSEENVRATLAVLEKHQGGEWMQVSFDKHQYGNKESGYTIHEATYFAGDDVLAGYDDDLLPVDEVELFSLVHQLATEDEDVDTIYFEAPERKESVEISIERSTLYEDAYLEWIDGDSGWVKQRS